MSLLVNKKEPTTPCGTIGSVALIGGDKRNRTYSAKQRQIYSLLRRISLCLAERVGFEPTNRSPDLHLSRVLHYRSAIFPFNAKADCPHGKSALGS